MTPVGFAEGAREAAFVRPERFLGFGEGGLGLLQLVVQLGHPYADLAEALTESTLQRGLFKEVDGLTKERIVGAAVNAIEDRYLERGEPWRPDAAPAGAWLQGPDGELLRVRSDGGLDHWPPRGPPVHRRRPHGREGAVTSCDQMAP